MLRSLYEYRKNKQTNKKFEMNEYDAVFFEDVKSANEFILNICKDKTVGIGDSHTLREMSIIEELKKESRELYSCTLDKSRENKLKSIMADVFILSANAVSEETGELVNIDSSCNRVAGSLYGPNEVIFVIGINKIEKDLTKAIYRARNVAAPMNSRVHEYNTPCVKTNKCEDCYTKDRICRATVIYHKRPKPMKTTIILINKNLGF